MRLHPLRALGEAAQHVRWAFSPDPHGVGYAQMMVARGDWHSLCEDWDWDEEDGVPVYQVPTARGELRATRFIERATNWTPLGWYLWSVWHGLSGDWGHVVCALTSHDLVDRSYGGPEHGNMDHECRRCGQYWSVPLY